MNKLHALTLLLACSLSAIADKQPNILWIVTDDHRADSVQAFNEATSGKKFSDLGYVMSPKADQLAKEGVMFTRAYCNSPGCAPSRTSMHLGQYPHRSGHYGFEKSHRSTDFAKQTFPELMKAQGYSTAQFGKTGYYIFNKDGKKYKPAVFYDTQFRLRDIFDHKLGDWSKTTLYANGKKGDTVVTWSDGDKKVSVATPQAGEMTPEMKGLKAKVDEESDILYASARDNTGLVIGGESPSETWNTIDGQITAGFLSYLDHQGQRYKSPWGSNMQGPASDKPLFVHLGFHFPHTPILPSKEFRELFMIKEKEIPYQVPDFSKDELTKLPAQMKRWFEKTNFADMQHEEKLQSIRDYYAFCAMGDYLVGESVEKFKQYSEASGREWLILYVIGDHGWHLGEQGGTSKFAPYDKSNHCAVIAVSSDKTKWPAGKVSHEWVEFVDFAPTILRAGGARLEEDQYAHLDGIPMDEIQSGKTTREYVIGEMNHVIGPRAYLRCENFAFSMRNRETNGKPGEKWGQKPGEDIKWALEAPRDLIEMTLFDLRSDGGEQNNVANDERYRALADWFRTKLGNIVLGDKRMECDWSQENSYVVSDFAEGAHNNKLDIPTSLISIGKLI